VITVPADVSANATGLFTKLKLGVATAVDSSGNKLAVSLVNTKQLFAPGEHLAYWQAIDSQGRSAIKSQKVMVKPLISISRNLVVAEGNEAKVTVFLNGPSPEYPVSIPYTVSGSSDSNDHDLIDGVVEITSGLSTTFTVNVFEDGEADADETIIITLDSSINISPQSQMHLLISEANVAPQTSIKITQSNEPRTQVSKLEGKVYIKAISQDVNTQDSLTEVWSTGDLVLETDAQGMYFDPSLVAAGSYPISLTVTDNGTPTLSTKVQLSLLVKESLPELTGADSDGDLIPDNVEGFADTDGDGIADYLDAINDCNVVQQQGREQSLFLAESQSGVCLRLGNTAQRNGSEGMKVLTSALTTDTEATNIGGIYDFEAVNLPTPGNSYRFSLPQTLPVPANAVYRKFNNANGWKAFILDDKNSIASSAGERGLCPPPGSTLWQSGLNEGHWCVQLTIEDGGPNDDDGITNGSIVDPGGVAVMLNSNMLPVAAADAVKVPVNQTAEIDVLANDTDADGDSLTLTQVSADFGQASISSDMTKVIYTPAVDFIGTDTLTYGVSDGKGGTASAQATVTVYINQAPQVTQVTASTDDRTAIDINVLANASDADGDTLSITAAAATEGTVTITNGAMLRYVPKAGFDGTDRISFAISDGRSGVAQGEVLVTVNAYEVITVVNKSSGGSVSGWPVALLALLVALRRRSAIATAFIALLWGMSFSAQANWSVDGLYGHSKTKQSASTISAKLPTGAEIVQYDNSAQSWALGVNYHFSSALSMQVHYVDLGETSLTLRADTLTPDTFYQSVQDIGPTQAEGISSGLSYRLWQHAGWTAGVHAGLFFWKSESSSTAGDITVRYQADDTDVYWGLNAGYSLDTHVMIKTSFTRYHLDGNKVDNLMFGVSYHF
jgi:large repetitive protein